MSMSVGEGILDERVEVGDDKVDRRNPCGCQLVKMCKLRAVREDAGVDSRVQRLDPAAKRFRHTADIRNRSTATSRSVKRYKATAGIDHLPCK